MSSSNSHRECELLARRVIEMAQSERVIDGLSEAEIERLCEYSTEVLKRDPAMVRVSAPVNIFGDLHGQFDHLLQWIEIVGRPPPAGRWLFLGDYVDRGARGLEVRSDRLTNVSGRFLIASTYRDLCRNRRLCIQFKCTLAEIVLKGEKNHAIQPLQPDSNSCVYQP